jgi:hypothetical protein
MNNEVPITILWDDPDYVLVGPRGPDRLPVLAKLSGSLPADMDALFDPMAGTFAAWLCDPASNRRRENLRDDLERVGRELIGGNVLDLLGIDAAGSRRVWVYTDSDASKLPIEAAYSDAIVGGGPLQYLVANENLRISFIRHLGFDPLPGLRIAKHRPLQMLVVFSNPGNLGAVTLEDGNLLRLTGSLQGDRAALERALGDLCRLNLLRIRFLVGDEEGQRVYAGEVVSAGKRSTELIWRVAEERDDAAGAGLAQRILEALTGAEAVHVWHYFGLGVVQAAGPALVTVPGDCLGSDMLAQAISGGRSPRIVILNACDSALPMGVRGGSAALTGFATVLLQRGTAALVCMLKQVRPDTASAATRAMYTELAGSLFTDPLALENALHDLRKAVHHPDNPRLDFFCPVLYRRRVEKETLFEYSDRRVAVWKMIRERKLTPAWPWHLWTAARWSTSLVGWAQR